MGPGFDIRRSRCRWSRPAECGTQCAQGGSTGRFRALEFRRKGVDLCPLSRPVVLRPCATTGFSRRSSAAVLDVSSGVRRFLTGIAASGRSTKRLFSKTAEPSRGRRFAPKTRSPSSTRQFDDEASGSGAGHDSDLCRVNAIPIPPVASGHHRASSQLWSHAGRPDHRSPREHRSSARRRWNRRSG